MEQVDSNAVLLDSNYVIDILNGAISPDEFISCQCVISAVTIMELYAFAGMSPGEERQIYEAMKQLFIAPVDALIAKRAGVLARTRKRGRADLIIAATALELNIPLLTKNTRDFKNIPSLRLLNA